MEGHCLEIPTPFRIGPVNCYLLEGPPTTLIDPGPATDDAFSTLGKKLADTGTPLESIDQVIITHPHMDHFGITNRVVATSDATVLAHTDAVRRLEDPFELFEHEQTFFTPFLQSMGVPEDIAVATTTLPEPYLKFQEAVSVDRALVGGDTVDAGIELEVLHTPGHAPGSVCFIDEDSRAVFTGDHVLAETSPNPFLTLEPGSTDERTRNLPAYVASLRTLLNLDLATGYPGHGRQIPDVHGRVRDLLDHHEERRAAVFSLVLEHEPVTAHRLMTELFPDLPTTETFAGLSEVVGHLDLLEDAGQIEAIETGSHIRYRTTPQ